MRRLRDGHHAAEAGLVARSLQHINRQNLGVMLHGRRTGWTMRLSNYEALFAINPMPTRRQDRDLRESWGCRAGWKRQRRHACPARRQLGRDQAMALLVAPPGVGEKRTRACGGSKRRPAPPRTRRNTPSWTVSGWPRSMRIAADGPGVRNSGEARIGCDSLQTSRPGLDLRRDRARALP